MAGLSERPRAFLNVTRSVTGRAWRERITPPQQAVAEQFVGHHDIPDVLARILAARGTTVETLESTLEPTLRRLMPDPATLTDMEAAASRLADAVQAGQTVAIFGDYDVDGACSAALLARVLQALGARPLVRIPDRLTEGYGPNIPAIEGFARAGAALLVTVDCGTTSFEPLARARELGLDVVVIDHHLADVALPPVTALVNPNRQDDLSGLGHLCAAGVTLMTCVALLRELRRRGADTAAVDLLTHLDVVALATVADVVPLTGLNRAFVARGLDLLRRRTSVGLTALCDVSRLGGPCEPYHLGFLLGPRINAGGRIGDAGLGARLLMTEDPDEAAIIAADLDRLNRERQVVEQAIVAEAIAEAETEIGAAGEGPPVLITSGAQWHPGVVGLVASRLKEKFQRPAFAIAFEGATGTGSGRSLTGVDLGRAVRRAVAEGLLVKGGGHPMAAGLTVQRERLPELRAFLNTELAVSVALARQDRSLAVDAAVTAQAATPAFVSLLQRAGPFGTGCPEPVIALPGHRVVFADVVGNGHVRVTVDGGGHRLKAVAFRAAGEPLGEALLAARGRVLHLAGELSLERWQGDERVEMRIRDAAHPDT